ncbi:MAG: extracellular solute-binding protein [Gordonia sp. (in: high G+C Gram-positive bacteria)]|uniref:extracellular solute-binding protein n=1 Tax=Gordonia sp. (in: high G+C Gram-positive bacteria) TaxID=84139 RepID=UPI0039E3DD4B
MKRSRRLLAVGAAMVTAVGVLAGCGSGDDGGAVTLYSGRSEELVGPLVSRLDSDGIELNVSYDRKANQILEEGEALPADVFFAQDAGELGRLADAGLLETLPTDITEVVDAKYRPSDNDWAPVTARARVLAFDPGKMSAADLPAGIDGLLDPRFKGQIGYAPTNASFKSFVTGLRVIRGDDGARDWLTKFLANEPKTFEKNGQILDAVNSGTVATGLINHYYWAAAVAEKGEAGVPARLHFFTDDPGGLVNVAGVAVLKSAEDKEAAFDVVRALLNDDSQRYFASETGEYPIAVDVPLDVPGLPRLNELSPPAIDLDELADLDGTEKLLTEVGAL